MLVSPAPLIAVVKKKLVAENDGTTMTESLNGGLPQYVYIVGNVP